MTLFKKIFNLVGSTGINIPVLWIIRKIKQSHKKHHPDIQL